LNNLIKTLFIGDVVGSTGIEAVKQFLPILVEKYKPDFILANGENAAAGKGITEAEADLLFSYGINALTSGNHIWENWKGKELLANCPNLIRPFNYPSGNLGKGFLFFENERLPQIAVLNLQGRTYMQTIDCPFKAADYALSLIVPKTSYIIVDFHAETTAEKIALANYLDGRVSAVIGTHTHVQTADAQIMQKGTAYISDVGMTGPYDSVVGLRKDIAYKRFTLQTPFKYQVATQEPRIAYVYFEMEIPSGKSNYIESQIFPELSRKRLIE
jgi:metallophosphoesterase (TIGR00282 family)